MSSKIAPERLPVCQHLPSFVEGRLSVADCPLAVGPSAFLHVVIALLEKQMISCLYYFLLLPTSVMMQICSRVVKRGELPVEFSGYSRLPVPPASRTACFTNIVLYFRPSVLYCSATLSPSFHATLLTVLNYSRASSLLLAMPATPAVRGCRNRSLTTH